MKEYPVLLRITGDAGETLANVRLSGVEILKEMPNEDAFKLIRNGTHWLSDYLSFNEGKLDPATGAARADN